MITGDKKITTPEYWDAVYGGSNNGAVDNSNTARPPNSFDRFGWVAGYAEGPRILDIGSGHAHVCKRIAAKHPEWLVIASDQARGAMDVSGYKPYAIIDAYHTPFEEKYFDTIICTQAMEYMEHQDSFLDEARRIGHKLLVTVPIGEMSKWSQLRIYTEANVLKLLVPLGEIEIFEPHGDLLLVKLKFNDTTKRNSDIVEKQLNEGAFE